MTDRLAAVAYRLLAPRATGGSAPGSGDDLANLNPSQLPEGALCQVLNGGATTLMQYTRAASPASAFSFQDGPPLIVAPSQGPGHWFATGGEAVNRLNFELLVNNPIVLLVTSGVNEWSVFPDSSPFFEPATPSLLPIFELTDAGNRLTYNGPTRKFQLLQTLTVANATGAFADSLGLMQSVNGALIGTTTSAPQSGNLEQADTQNQQQITQQQTLILNPADTLQPIFRSINGDDYTVIRWSLQVRDAA